MLWVGAAGNGVTLQDMKKQISSRFPQAYVRRILEAFNAGELDAARACLTHPADGNYLPEPYPVPNDR